jgi:hypothetical protein
LQRAGAALVKRSEESYTPTDTERSDEELYAAVKRFTMTSRERVLALRDAVDYVVKAHIPGDIVECGVWKGGSMMVVAKTLLTHRENRVLHLFDTFEGMTEPGEHDRDFRGVIASERLRSADRDSSLAWGYGPLEEVRANLASTGYDESWCRFEKGPVEKTIPAGAPDKIAILRLDTDWYESTYHESQHLFPRLSPGGVLLIDDYGHWQGARRAVDQYFTENGVDILLNRIDYTGRVGVKVHPS